MLNVISRLDKVKLNCRKKILNRFTLEQMAQNMDKQFDYIYNNPNKDKIKMGLALNKSIGITKELIIASMFEDKDKTIYQSSNFFEKVYSKDVKKVKKLKEHQVMPKLGIIRIGEKN